MGVHANETAARLRSIESCRSGLAIHVALDAGGRVRRFDRLDRLGLRLARFAIQGARQVLQASTERALESAGGVSL